MSVMREAEARTKWCPMARVSHWNAPSGNRSLKPGSGFGADEVKEQTVDEAARCVGSACMAWQWHNRVLGHDPEYNGAEAAKRFTQQNPLKGYCGLAEGK
jgi:hypothetical protein